MIFKQPTFFGETPEIEVEFVNHAALEEAVANALAVAGGLDASDLDVTVREGNVVLGGVVATVAQVERAAAVARAVTGVKSVQNDIRVA
ncbi:BON domain-containing protein [Rhizobium sp. Root1220]|uniref:BON domain-containing protein n=1 Tax=Rhizobium sp. Root1220 TaxID=1736432 RepID=UPI0006F1FF1B|nr:BON domain-containing protein [Rhizobium sp. Root1220]KQV73236.1 transporter [Rhizobium sp. Root1220]